MCNVHMPSFLLALLGFAPHLRNASTPTVRIRVRVKDRVRVWFMVRVGTKTEETLFFLVVITTSGTKEKTLHNLWVFMYHGRAGF